jgi:adenylate cyclase
MTAPERGTTVAFVDLAGFTALTDAHGDEQAVATLGSFSTALAAALDDHAQCVKHLGDGALLVSDDGAGLVGCLAELARTWSADPHAPLLRAGVHAGPVVRVDTVHGPDYLGGTVNAAARLCEIAAGGMLVHSSALTSAVAAAGLPSRPLGARRLRGIAAPVEAWAVDLTASSDVPVDPVCRMPVPAGTGAGRLVHEGTEHSFCSLDCAGRFAAAPGAYAPTAPADR